MTFAGNLARGAWRFVPVLLVLAAWELAVLVGLISPAFLPPFTEVAVTTWTQMTGGALLENILISLWRVAAGFVLAVVFGVAIGIGMARVRPFELGVRPLVTLWYPVPVPALFPVLLLILKLGDQLQIAIIMLGSILPVIVASFNAARGVDQYLVWSARNMGTSQAAVLWKIILPAALPEILSGVRMTLALAFVLLVASEQLGARGGVGQFTLTAGENGFYAGMFAGILMIGLLGYLADRLFLVGMRRVLRWRDDVA